MDLLELFPATAAGRTKSLTLRSKTSLSPKVRLGCNAAAGLRRRPGRPVFALKNDGSATGSWVLRGSPKMGDGARPTFQQRHGLIPLKISLTVFVPGTSQPRGHPQLGLGNRKAFTRDPSKLAARRTRSPDDVRIRPRRMPVNHQRARRSGAVETVCLARGSGPVPVRPGLGLIPALASTGPCPAANPDRQWQRACPASCDPLQPPAAPSPCPCH
jgi:hypothetical protein